MADDGLDAGAPDGADPLPDHDRPTRANDFYTFWNNWRHTQAARRTRVTLSKES